MFRRTVVELSNSYFAINHNEITNVLSCGILFLLEAGYKAYQYVLLNYILHHHIFSTEKVFLEKNILHKSRAEKDLFNHLILQ